jgi:hypothetical protein
MGRTRRKERGKDAELSVVGTRAGWSTGAGLRVAFGWWISRQQARFGEGIGLGEGDPNIGYVLGTAVFIYTAFFQLIST